MVATDTSAKEYGDLFSTMSVCLSKGLGAPIGSAHHGLEGSYSTSMALAKDARWGNAAGRDPSCGWTLRFGQRVAEVVGRPRQCATSGEIAVYKTSESQST